MTTLNSLHGTLRMWVGYGRVVHSTRCFWIPVCKVHILTCRFDVFYGIHLWGKNLNSLYVPWYLHSCLNVKYSVKCLHSWFPRRRKKVVGCSIFKAHRYSTHWNRKHCFKPQTTKNLMCKPEQFGLRMPYFSDIHLHSNKNDQ